MPGDIGGGGGWGRCIMKKVSNGDIGGGGLKFGIFAVESFFSGPYPYCISCRIYFGVVPGM